MRYAALTTQGKGLAHPVSQGRTVRGLQVGTELRSSEPPHLLEGASKPLVNPFHFCFLTSKFGHQSFKVNFPKGHRRTVESVHASQPRVSVRLGLNFCSHARATLGGARVTCKAGGSTQSLGVAGLPLCSILQLPLLGLLQHVPTARGAAGGRLALLQDGRTVHRQRPLSIACITAGDGGVFQSPMPKHWRLWA